MSNSLAARFFRLFVGYEHCHGCFKPTGQNEKGKITGKAYTLPGPTTPELWQAHLTGAMGVGSIPIRSNGACLWGGVDLDIYDIDPRRIAEQLEEWGIPAIAVRSKSGGVHVYVWAGSEIPTWLFRKKLAELCQALGHEPKELFPKQETPTEDGGNWLNMPYFGGESTTRYAVKPNGDAYSPEEFCTKAEEFKAITTAEWFSKPLALPDKKQPSGDCQPIEYFIKLALEKIRNGESRHNTGLWWLCEARDAGYDRDDVFPRLAAWVQNVNAIAPGRERPYTLKEVEDVWQHVYAKITRKGVGFSERLDGVFHTTIAETGKNVGQPVSMFVCGPLSVIAYARTASDNADKAWSMLLRLTDRDGEPQELVLPNDSLDTPGNPWLGQLHRAGLVVGATADAKRLLKQYLQTRKVERRLRLVERIGWTDDRSVYMLPSGAVPDLAKDGEEFVYKNHGRQPLAAFAIKGNLNEWRENVSRYCEGNSRLVFSVSAAFLGPMLPLIGATEGRAFHFSGGTSSGKTTCLQISGSVCGGGGKLGFVQKWHSTPNAMEGVAAAHNHCILLLDELGEMDPRKAGELSYIITGGLGKQRMTRNAQLRESASWLNLIVSTGEISLEQHLKSADTDARMMGGQEVRFISIPADAGAGLGAFENLHGTVDSSGGSDAGAFSNLLKRSTSEYYGVAFIAWIAALAARTDSLVKRSQIIAADFRSNYARQVSPQIGRVAESFALVAAAGELATEESITGWEKGEATGAAAKCFAAWRKDRGTEGSSDEEAILKRIRLFFQLHGSSRFERISNPGFQGAPRLINRAGFFVPNDSEFWTYSEVFESEVCRGFNHKQVCRVLEKHGYLVKDGQHFKAKRSVPEQGRMRVYVLRQTIVGEVDETLRLIDVSGYRPSDADAPAA